MTGRIPALAGSARPLLFCDYDGTLVPLVSHPGLASLPAQRRSRLAEIGSFVPLTIVSGRSLEDLCERVGIDGLGYIGNHGYEMRLGDRRWTHPGVRECAAAMALLRADVARRVREYPDAWIEDKGLTFSVHFRLAACGDRKAVFREVARLARGYEQQIELRRGKMVVDIRPRLSWGKGQGVLQMVAWREQRRVSPIVYIGDDDTDEDAFRDLAADPNATTIVVGNRRHSLAKRRLPDVGAVWTYLGDLRRACLAEHGSGA